MATSNGIISGAMTPDYTAQAKQLYKDNFGRDGDEEGVNYWAGQLAAGKSADQVQSDFDTAAQQHYNQYAANPAAYDAANPGKSDYFKNDPGAIAAMQAASAKPAGNAAATPQASTYTAAQLGDPTKWTVTPEQTAAGLINQYTDPNSPIIQSAMTRAKEQQNANGTLNSSMAITAGQKAAYDAAIPLAQQDAQTYSKAAGYNADESNQFAVQNVNSKNAAGQFNAGQQNQLTGQKLAADTSIATANIGAKSQLDTAKISADTQKTIAQLQAQTQTNLGYLDATTKTNLANLDANTRTNLAAIEANYHTLMQSNASASDLFRQVTQNITNISLSKDMDAPAKQAAVNNQLKMLQNGMSINGAISNLDLGNLLDFSTVNQPVAATPASTTATTPSAAIER